MGWTHSSTLKDEFEIADDLVNKIVFMATYNDKFKNHMSVVLKLLRATSSVPALSIAETTGWSF